MPQWTEDDMAAAIELINDGQTSIRDAEKSCNIPRMTLHGRMTESRSHRDAHAHEMLMTEQQEEDLGNWISDLDCRHQPPSIPLENTRSRTRIQERKPVRLVSCLDLIATTTLTTKKPSLLINSRATLLHQLRRLTIRLYGDKLMRDSIQCSHVWLLTSSQHQLCHLSASGCSLEVAECLRSWLNASLIQL
jgi:hypothetical protein